jgi:prevent-host-death family protein
MKTIPAGEFKAKCLALLDEVRDSHTEIVVTKRGKPIAKLVPIAQEPSRSTLGQLSGTVKINCSLEDLFSTGEAWNE